MDAKNVFKSDAGMKYETFSKLPGAAKVPGTSTSWETKVWQRELRSYTSHITIIYDRWESPHKTGLGFTFTGRLIYRAFHTPQR